MSVTMRFARHSDRSAIALDPDLTLGAGGEARVFVVPGSDQTVAKIYRRPTEQHARKLTVMLANPPADPMAAQNHVSIAWPTDLLDVADGSNRTVGFLMPRADGTRPLIDFYNPATRRRVCPLFNPLYLLRTARNLAAAMHAVHSRGYVIGDVNESNILVTDTALVTLVDTDSFQVQDPDSGEMFRCPVGKPEFTPPELQGEVFRHIDRAPEHDRFGLAVLIFQLLMEGTHPFGGLYTGEGDPPPYPQRIQSGDFQYGTRQAPYRPMPVAPPFETLPPELRELFIRCFEDGHSDPTLRPDAETWVSALQQAEIDQVICRVNDQHRYGKHLNSCPWCARRLRFQGRDPFPSKEVVRRGEHLRAVQPSQASLPSAVNIAPAAPATPPTPVLPAPDAPAPDPDAALNLHPSKPVAATPPGPAKPAIMATRGAVRAARRPVPRGILVLILVSLIALGALFAMVVMASARRETVSKELNAARAALTSAQTAGAGLASDTVKVDEAVQQLSELTSRADEATRHALNALALDSANKEAIAIRDRSKTIKESGGAAVEALQAKSALDGVVQQIDQYKDAELTAAEADAVRTNLKQECQKALSHAAQALNLDAKSASAWVQRVRAYRLLGDATEAGKALRSAMQLFPGNASLLEQKSLLEGGG